MAAAIGYFALALAVNRALAGEKRRLSATLAELARLKHGIDQLADEPDDAPAPRASAAEALRQVSDEGRRARQLDRASELDLALGRVLDVALEATAAHAVLYFDLDRQRELAHLRVMRGPASLVPDCAVPLGSDPFSFLIERGQTFYATDFKRLLHELPWYRGRVEIGTLRRRPGARGRRDRGRRSWPTSSRSRRSPGASRGCSPASPSSRPRRSARRAPRSGARSSTPSSRPSTRSRSGSRCSRAKARCASCCCARRATSPTSRAARW